MNISEKLIREVIAKAVSRGPSGDISDALYAGGAISKDQYQSLKKRDPHVTGNPIDIKKKFFEQNPK